MTIRRLKIGLGVFSIFLLALIILLSSFSTRIFGLNKPKNYYVPPYAYLDIMSGNFRPLVAQMFLIRGIMSIAEKDPQSFDFILDNLKLAAQLDPKLTYAYIVAGIIAPRNGQELRRATIFMKQGMENAPDDWRLPFWIGFNYMQMGDNLKAAEYYRRASTLPRAPNYVKSMTAFYYYQADKSDMALVYLESVRNYIKNSHTLQNIDLKITWLQNIVFLEEKVKAFRQASGRWPDDLDELVKAGLIDKIPHDTFGKGYELDKNQAKYPGRVKSRF
jgi:tetratricopeptide (TPR) repeat protein